MISKIHKMFSCGMISGSSSNFEVNVIIYRQIQEFSRLGMRNVVGFFLQRERLLF